MAAPLKPKLSTEQSAQQRNSRIPVIADRDSYSGAKSPVLSKAGYESEWSFSFQFFNQIPDFGLDTPKADGKWFVSLLQKFRELCRTDLSDFLKNMQLRQDWRYHKIDWDSRNVPIKRSDCDWVKREFLENDEDFPFYQFHVSKALGRVMGFWGPGSRMFYVVLLDPMHNIQPSKYNDYKVDPNYPLSCEYSSILLKVQHVLEIGCANPDCKAIATLKNAVDKAVSTNFIYCDLDDDFVPYLDKYTFKQILEAGITLLES